MRYSYGDLVIDDTHMVIGVNRFSMPRGAMERFDCVAILLQDLNTKEYACYQAIATGDESDCVRHGDKVSFERACCHFPGLSSIKKEQYRL